MFYKFPHLSAFDLFAHSKIGEEQSSEDAEDGPPELLVCSATTSLIDWLIYWKLINNS